MVDHVRELCVVGKLADAIRFAFDRVVSDTIRHYGLNVPTGCTSLEFVAQHLRADMGKLSDLLPELYGLYEPVRFGEVPPADPGPIQTLVERIYTDTPLARAYDPLSQSRGPSDRGSRKTFSVSHGTVSESWMRP